jgi:2-hydroxychromene-2-carboxylate isomerase
MVVNSRHHPRMAAGRDQSYSAEMANPATLTVYTDYKSPYAFLAKDRIYALAAETGVLVDWQPYVLDVPRYLGSATVDDDGAVVEANRNAHQWRRIRYMFMDCRRQAAKQGLVLRSTQKIWDSAPAAAGMLFAQRHGEVEFRHYHDTVFDRFWKRDLDIENIDTLATVLTEAGADGAGFAGFLPSGLALVAEIARAAEAIGVFGVPTFMLDNEMFWGGEHLPTIFEMLTAGAAAAGPAN